LKEVRNVDTKEFEKMSIEETAKVLQTNPDIGLSEEEAQERVKKYGKK
jgi:magnesium-transporting ATPase (P-type)